MQEDLSDPDFFKTKWFPLHSVAPICLLAVSGPSGRSFLLAIKLFFLYDVLRFFGTMIRLSMFNERILVILFIGLTTSSLPAQTVGQWKKLPNAPYPGSRMNDGFFISSTTGWFVSGNNSSASGKIYRTTDGGASWQLQFQKSNTHFRSVGFVDSLNGWAGCLGKGDVNNPASTDTSILYQTSDGGGTWKPVPALSGQLSRGFCGMHIFGDSLICAVGRVRGPAWFYRSTDPGKTWNAKDMNSYAGGLIDTYFFTPDSGVAVGLTNTLHDSSSGVILFTGDGGQTWEQKFKTARKGEWCWKISFPSHDVGYVSLQRNSLSPIYFLKTTDGGQTWKEKLFSSNYYFVQGIGFVNDTLGWVGGYSSIPMYETTNGGETWHSTGLGKRVNRFRMLSQTLGYCVGDSVYKYTTSTVGFAQREQPSEQQFDLRPNYPNPFNPETKIEFRVSKPSYVTIYIYDIGGSRIRTIISQEVEAGSHLLSWDGLNESGELMATGTYFYQLQARRIDETKAREYFETKKMLLLR